jgi:hypothetical protein
MAQAQYVVTGYNRETIIVKVIVGDKSEFVNLMWTGASPIEEFLRYHVNMIAHRMSQTKPHIDLASAVGRTGNFEIEDPARMLMPQPMAPPPKSEPPKPAPA